MEGKDETAGTTATATPSTPPAAPTAPLLLASLAAAPTIPALATILADLSAAISARAITVTKAEVLAACKAKKAAEGGAWWTKEAAVGLKAVLKAFGRATSVAALPAVCVGHLVVVGKPLSPDRTLKETLIDDETGLACGGVATVPKVIQRKGGKDALAPSVPTLPPPPPLLVSCAYFPAIAPRHGRS
jgi:hypothetical protein